MFFKLVYSLTSLLIVIAVYPIKISEVLNENILSGVYHCVIWASILYFIWRTPLISIFHNAIKSIFYKKSSTSLQKVDSHDYYQWIYIVRGFAIIAVVVCHQQFFLHSTEWLQMFSLYSVTAFVFCMGLTKWISLEKRNNSQTKTKKKAGGGLAKILTEYFLATILYLAVASSFNWLNVFNSLLSFNASGPLYFIAYTIIFSLLAPFLYLWVKYKTHNLLDLLFGLLIMYVIPYITFEHLNIFGASYLVVYVMGMLCSKKGYYEVKKQHAVFAIIVWGGSVSLLYDFFFQYIEGNSTVATRIVNFFVPKYTINPPNITVMIYALATVNLIYVVYELTKNIRILDYIYFILIQLGKYSLDIFIWHLLIQRFWVVHREIITNIWMFRVVVYFTMFIIPILCRKIYEEIKTNVKELLKENAMI